MLNLYFSPLACSLASRIVLYEAGVPATYTIVDTKAKRLRDGSDFHAINPMGQVPALLTDEGVVLTENTAVLQYLADRFPKAQLAPPSGIDRSRLQQWLGFIGTELHKALFVPLLDAKASADVKAYSRDKAALRLGLLEKHLSSNEYLMDRFSIADAYLTTVLNWARYSGVTLTEWPAVAAYYQRMLERPSIAQAIGEEYEMYKEETAQRK